MAIDPISNLPLPPEDLDSSDAALRFFNNYYQEGTAIKREELDATIAFFGGRGFSQSASESIATVLIIQARKQKVNIFGLLDTLKTLNGVQLSVVVKEILNANRLRISTLATRLDNTDNINFELRNVLP